MIRQFCDRCGVEIQSGTGAILTLYNPKSAPDEKGMELCADCTKSLNRWMAFPLAEILIPEVLEEVDG